MTTQTQMEASSYEVEVSGWDREQSFFVEKTTLEWYENVAKIIYVRHPISTGAVVFVRVIDPTSEKNAFPLAYQADSVSLPDLNGVRKVLLNQLHPRAVMPNLRRIAASERREQVN